MLQALKRDQISICMLNIRGLSRILSSLIRPLNFMQNDRCATSDEDKNFNISKNMLCKGWISNSLCGRTIFSSLFLI